MIDNMEVNKEENHVLVSINPKIYPLDVVYNAAYIFIDENYVLIDGDPENEILVQLRPKSNVDLLKLGREFNNELIHYANYTTQSTRNAKLREEILKRVLLTNDVVTPEIKEESGEQKITDVPWDKEKDGLSSEDPEDIAVPWEEKYGKDKDKQGTK